MGLPRSACECRRDVRISAARCVLPRRCSLYPRGANPHLPLPMPGPASVQTLNPCVQRPCEKPQRSGRAWRVRTCMHLQAGPRFVTICCSWPGRIRRREKRLALPVCTCVPAARRSNVCMRWTPPTSSGSSTSLLRMAFYRRNGRARGRRCGMAADDTRCRRSGFSGEVLKLAQPQVQRGEVSGDQVALLTDDILSGRGQPQRYGTNFILRDGELKPAPIEDEANVDRRRQALGMISLASYACIHRATHGSPSPQAPNPSGASH